jgi:hypothetical protein
MKKVLTLHHGQATEGLIEDLVIKRRDFRLSDYGLVYSPRNTWNPLTKVVASPVVRQNQKIRFTQEKLFFVITLP